MSTRSTTSLIRARRGHKERSKNFTELEKRTVLELIARHRDVLRQGRSNNATNRSKQLVWSTICEEVNNRCGGERPRTPAQVKMWYENYKKKCKMRSNDVHVTQTPPDPPGILDGMLWQSIHPLDVKEEEDQATTSVEGAHSVKDEDTPVNMTNGRLSSANESDDTSANVLEPHVQIQSPPGVTRLAAHDQVTNMIQSPTEAPPWLPTHDQARIQQNLLLRLNELSNTPLNLSNLDDVRRKNGHDRHPSPIRRDYPTATEEERVYFSTKRQHAAWEHEAKMKILNMELRQKEEIFSLQKQLFLIELRLKMDFLEKHQPK